MHNLPQPRVSLVVPSKNGARTLPACLHAACELVQEGLLIEIILVDDGSTDDTPQVIAPWVDHVQLLQTGGRGPAAARNAGWRIARGDWIWFIDADCIADAESLRTLIQAILEEQADRMTGAATAMAGIGGSYTNRQPHSLLARWIQAEIAARHARMPRNVEFLGSFNVLYNRAVLTEVGGFDERRFPLPSAEDNDLAYRIRSRGYQLRFERAATVGHFHPTHWGRYLRTQARHGYYRTVLYLRHPTRVAGDSYSGLIDHLQPLLACALIPSVAIGLWQQSLAIPILTLALLWLSTMPMTWRVYHQQRRWLDLGFSGLSFVRSFARAAGMGLGALDAIREPLGRVFLKAKLPFVERNRPV